MKILFIDSFERIELVGIMQLSAVLKQHGHETEFLDVRLERDVSRAVQVSAPDVIAYSVTTGKHRAFQQLNSELKRRCRFFSVFGGPHCTFFPDFIEADGVDAVCVGEGEFAFPELVDALGNGNDITRIPNIWAKVDGTIHRNEVRDLVEDLDCLPFPDRDLCDKYNHYRRMSMRYVMAGRGCPYNCTFCFNHVFNTLYKGKGRILRRRSVPNVIAEMKELQQRYGTRRFNIIDDTFVLDRRWVLEFCDAYAAEIGAPFDVNVRANMTDPELAAALGRAGCRVAAYSIESGNERIRRQVLKRDLSDEELVRTAGLLRQHGIRVQIQNMLALPDETLETAFETLRLNIRCKPTYAWAALYQPFPGTELCRYAVSKGYFDGNPDRMESYFTRSPLKLKDVRQMERLHHLFSIAVDYPFLLPLVRWLIRLPLKPLYKLLWLVHKTVYVVFKARWLRPYELFLRR